MSIHTPGPWSLAEAAQTIPIKGANGKTVASVRYGPTDLDDARLIAAAPDLLTALQDIMDRLSYRLVPSEREKENARAAIAKARGAP